MSTYGNVSVALNATEFVNISKVTVPDVRPCHLSEMKRMTMMNQCFLGRLSSVYISQLMQFSLLFWRNIPLF